VDDNAAARKVLAAQLQQLGIQAVCVDNAAAALNNLVHAHKQATYFDVALIDQEMPNVDGISLGLQIAANPALSATRLLLLTTSSQIPDASMLKQSGFAGYVSKPVMQQDLLISLRAVLSASSPAVPMDTQAALASQPNVAYERDQWLILLAEDNAVNELVAVRTLKLFGYRVETVRDGRQALQAWESGRYDLILMDCQMPLLDGYEATREIRRREGCQPRIPIIALTAHAMKGDDLKCTEAGMDAHLTKPIDRNELQACLDRYLQAPHPHLLRQ
jgi:CheY-like chemotaxis protein